MSKPYIFWFSDPVRPDETLVISGEDISSSAVLEIADCKGKWTAVKPLQTSKQSLKAVIPAKLPFGVYTCRIRQGKDVSREIEVNAADVWWCQGKGGAASAEAGDELRFFGKCLALGGQSKVKFGDAEVKCSLSDMFELKVKVPAGLPEGVLPLQVFNGSRWAKAGECRITRPQKDTRTVIHLEGNPALDPTGKKDCTIAFVEAMERARCMEEGAIIQLPPGRFRVDAILRPMTWMNSQLFVMENVSLRGAGADKTSIWFTDKKEALPCLIECANNSEIKDLAVYAQGPLHEGIKASSNVNLENLILRLNPFYMTCGYEPGKCHHERPVPEKNDWGGPGITIWGKNCRVKNCDILAQTGITVYGGFGSQITGNKIFVVNGMGASICGGKLVFEDNEIIGGSNNIAMFGPKINMHVCYRRNSVAHKYTGDHECLTFDGHGTGYFGKVCCAHGNQFKLIGDVIPPSGKGSMWDILNTAVYIVDGRGAGQIRFLKSYDETNKTVTLDEPWEVQPDNTSTVEIGVFNGRHLVLDNRGEDAGTLVQLYPTNNQNIVSGNKGIRTGNLNCLSHSGSWVSAEQINQLSRFEISWYNQFLDNEIVVGNYWGGGVTEVDRWLGGEATLKIHGEAMERIPKNGEVIRRQMSPEFLQRALGESKPRKVNMAPSRFNIVRRHVVQNNSSIQVLGCVSDALIEKCVLKNSARGIRIDMERDCEFPNNCGQTHDWEGGDAEPIPFQRPQNILVRDNEFENVKQPYSGCGLECALILDKDTGK